MTKEKNYKQLFLELYNKYKHEMFIYPGEKGQFCSYIDSRVIMLDPDTWENTNEWMLFATLHEIGHIKTNTSKMKQYMKEYLATQWALEESRRLGFEVSKRIISIYQNYILDWREKSIKRKAKNVVSKSELILH